MKKQQNETEFQRSLIFGTYSDTIGTIYLPAQQVPVACFHSNPDHQTLSAKQH